MAKEGIENLSPAQAALVSAVDVLAVNDGGDTVDIVRNGKVEVYPGVQLLAQVVDTSFHKEDELTLVYSLQAVVGDNAYDESVSVSPDDAYTELVVDEGSPHEGDSAPDYAIQSFLDRFYVLKVIEAAQGEDAA